MVQIYVSSHLVLPLVCNWRDGRGFRRSCLGCHGRMMSYAGVNGSVEKHAGQFWMVPSYTSEIGVFMPKV